MKNLKHIVFWGAMWGIMEATLGWFLHLIQFRGEMFILYPFGLLCMLMAARQTGQISATVKVAGVAAIIKLVNLFMIPVVPTFHVTNPAVAVFIEGLVTWGFYGLIQRNKITWRFALPVAVTMVLISSFLFRGWQIFMDTFIAHNPRFSTAFNLTILSKMGWYSVVQAVMLVAMVYLIDRVSINFSFSKWSSRLALPVLLVALLLNFLI